MRVASEKVERQNAKSGDNSDGEPRAEFVFAEDRVTRGREPVSQRGLFKPFDLAQARRDPIPTRVHFARDFGVARLVGADERQTSEQVEEDNRAQDDQRNQMKTFRIVSCFD